jgi:hypothetical protein
MIDVCEHVVYFGFAQEEVVLVASNSSPEYADHNDVAEGCHFFPFNFLTISTT